MRDIVSPGDDGRFERWDEGEIRASLETLGTLNWTWYEFGGDAASRAEEWRKLGQLPKALHDQLGEVDLSRTIAVVDQTSLYNAVQLLNGGRVFDPFVAILDLTSIIGAAIFYDTVLAIGADGLPTRVNDALGLENVFCEIQPRTLDSSMKGRWRIESVLSAMFEDAVHELDRGHRDEQQWMDALKTAWRGVLPQVAFPDHETHVILRDLGYSLSPGPRVLQAIFDRDTNIFRYADPHELEKLIHYNNVRALFYEKVANMLGAVLSSDGSSLSVHYVGNCLRTPMAFARARLSESLLNSSSPSVENWLQREWAAKYRASEFVVRTPLWLNAVLADVADRADFSRSVRRMRSAANGLRRRRQEIEVALARGDEKVMRDLRSALRGESDEFQRKAGEASKAVLSSADMVASAYLPPGTVRTLVQAAGRFGSDAETGWLGTLAQRLFRPHLRFVQTLGKKAETTHKSLERMFELFELERAVADEPARFLTRLASIS